MARRERQARASVLAARGGSAAEFEVLFREHWSGAYRAAYLVVHDAAAAEDIAQEAFLAAVRALDRFDRRRPFAPWPHRIVVNRAIDWTRSRTIRREVVSSDLEEKAASEDISLGGDSYSPELVSALAGLSADQRAVIVLRHLLGYSPGEIAKMLELPRGTVNSRLRRGLDELGTALGEEAE